MNCTQARSLFSPYLDGAVTGAQMQAISAHLSICLACGREYRALSRTQALVSSIGRRPAPPDLSLRLRVALSQEAMRVPRRRLEALLVQFENVVRAFMVPATAGVLSAIVFFGLLIGLIAVPPSLNAAEDVPSGLYTPPQLVASPFLHSVETDLVVETFVDSKGRVQDFRIISAPGDPNEYAPELKKMMIFTVFRPATLFGRPTADRVVLSFSSIHVRG
jgi:anti-sigma factor RsiW